MNRLKTLALSLINLFLKKLFVEKIYKKLYLDHHNIYVHISAKNYSFLYRSVDYDDLNMMCRENLKFWESSSREIFSELAKSSNSIIDVGSYTGIYALIAAKSNKKATVIAFEPNPNLFDALSKNIKLNNLTKIKLENLALDNVVGVDYLYVNHESYTSVASLIQSANTSAKFQIKKTTLDNYCQENKISSVDLIKIDVEGVEKRVLEGAGQVLHKYSPIIIMESLTLNDLKHQKNVLKNLNYLEPIQIKGDGYDSNNWLWFTKKDKNKINNIISYKKFLK